MKRQKAWGDWIALSKDQDLPFAIDCLPMLFTQMLSTARKLKKNPRKGLLTFRIHLKSRRIAWVWEPARDPKRICLR